MKVKKNDCGLWSGGCCGAMEKEIFEGISKASEWGKKGRETKERIKGRFKPGVLEKDVDMNRIMEMRSE